MLKKKKTVRKPTVWYFDPWDPLCFPECFPGFSDYLSCWPSCWKYCPKKKNKKCFNEYASETDLSWHLPWQTDGHFQGI